MLNPTVIRERLLEVVEDDEATVGSPTNDDRPGTEVEVDDALEGVLLLPDLPDILPSWANSKDVLLATAELRARRAWHMAKFYGLRSPKYMGRFLWRGTVGMWRGGWMLSDWIRHGESAPLVEKAIKDLDHDSYRMLHTIRQDHLKVRGIVTGATALVLGGGAAAEFFLIPGLLWAEAAAAWAVAAWHGGPWDDPGFFEEPDMPIRLDLNVEHLNEAWRAAGLLKGKNDDDDAPRLVMVQPPMRDTFRSWSAVVDQPRGSGKTAKDVIAKRDVIAAELGVDEIQLDLRRVRSANKGHAGRTSVWVCDEDPYLQDKPTLSPLAEMEFFSIWDAIPFGRDARSNRVDLAVMWQSAFFGGLPRRGKTAAQRIVSAAGALDAIVRHWIADGKGGGDWKPMQRIAHRFVHGAEAEAVEALERMLDEIIAEMEKAFKVISSIPLHIAPDAKITPKILARYGLTINLVTIDELQEYLSAITDAKRKDALIEKLCRIARRGPAAGYISNFASQRPDADSVPTKLRDIVTLRYCTQVVDRTSSDMVLGKAKATQGADASILSEEHVGCGVLVTGPSNFTIVLTDYIDLPTFAAICERGRDLRITAGTLSGEAADDTLSGELANVIPQVLADVLMLMRHVDRGMHTQELTNRLVNLDEGTYGDWTPDRLADALADAGVERSTTQVKIDGVNRNGYWKSDLQAAAEQYGSTD
jgi:S-DNA-T family DNA segregation ATPase FtsK/SpoIIIE